MPIVNANHYLALCCYSAKLNKEKEKEEKGGGKGKGANRTT